LPTTIIKKKLLQLCLEAIFKGGTMEMGV